MAESSRPPEKKDVELSALIESFVSCPTVKSGVLLKQGGKLRRKWQSRYFYLKYGAEGTALLYTDGPCYESICACGARQETTTPPTASASASASSSTAVTKICARCGRGKKPAPKGWPILTPGKVLGLIQINGAWIHKLQASVAASCSSSSSSSTNAAAAASSKEEEFSSRPMFGISRSNKDKMIVLSTATTDEREEWMSLMVIQGALKFDSSGKSRIHMDSAKEGYLRAFSPKINKGKWTRAYFVLTQSHSLQCFLSYKTDPHMLHEIPVRNAKIQPEANELYNQVFTFSVLPAEQGSKPTILVAETELEQKDWLSCLMQSSAGKTARPHLRRKSDTEEPSEESASFVGNEGNNKALLQSGGNKRNQESIMEGKLEVVERNLGVVKRKTFYFVLRGAHLAYFVHRSDYKPAGDISLSGCEVKLLSELVGKLGFVVRPARRKKRYELYAKTSQELYEWVGALQAQIAALKKISDGAMENVDVGKETDTYHGIYHYTSHDPLMEGNMMKKGKRRYFRAFNDALVYYKTRLDTRPRGVIELACCGLKIEDNMEGYIFSLQPITHTEERKFLLVLNSLEELEAWTNMLRALIARESITKVDPHSSTKEGFLWKVSPRDVKIRYVVLSSSLVLSVYKTKRHAKEVMSGQGGNDSASSTPLMTINLLKATVTKDENIKLPTTQQNSDNLTKINSDFTFTVLPAPEKKDNNNSSSGNSSSSSSGSSGSSSSNVLSSSSGNNKGREHSFVAESRLVMQQWMDVIKASADLARDMHSLVYKREMEFQSEPVFFPAHMDCALDESFWPRAYEDDLSELSSFLSSQLAAQIATEKVANDKEGSLGVNSSSNSSGNNNNLSMQDNDPTRQEQISSEAFFEKLRQEEKDRQEAAQLRRQQIADRVEGKESKKLSKKESSSELTIRETSLNLSPTFSSRKFSHSSNHPGSDDEQDSPASLSPRNSETKETKDADLDFAEIHFGPEFSSSNNNNNSRKFGASGNHGSSEDEDDDDDKPPPPPPLPPLSPSSSSSPFHHHPSSSHESVSNNKKVMLSLHKPQVSPRPKKGAVILTTPAVNQTAEAFLVENFGRAPGAPVRNRYRSDFMLVQTGVGVGESNSYSVMETGFEEDTTNSSVLTTKQCEKLLAHLRQAKFAPESMQSLMDRLTVLCALPENAQLLLQCGASDVLGAVMKQWNEIESVFYAVATVFATIHENAALMQDIVAKVDEDPLTNLIPGSQRDGGLKECACVLKALSEAKKPGQIESRTLQLLLDRTATLCQKSENATFLLGSDVAPTLVSLMHAWEKDEEVCLSLAEAHARLSEGARDERTAVKICEKASTSTSASFSEKKKAPPPPVSSPGNNSANKSASTPITKTSDQTKSSSSTAANSSGSARVGEKKVPPPPSPTPKSLASPILNATPTSPNSSSMPLPSSLSPRTSTSTPSSTAPTTAVSGAVTTTSATSSSSTSNSSASSATASMSKPVHPARRPMFVSRISSAKRGSEAEAAQSSELLINRIQQSCAAKATDSSRKAAVSEVVNKFKSMEKKEAVTPFRSRASRTEVDANTVAALRLAARELAWRSQDSASIPAPALRAILGSFAQLLKFHLDDADLVVSACAGITHLFKRGMNPNELRDDAIEEQAISLLFEALTMEYYGDSPEVKLHAVVAITAFLRNKSSLTPRLIRKCGGMGTLLTLKKNNAKHGLLVQACAETITAINSL